MPANDIPTTLFVPKEWQQPPTRLDGLLLLCVGLAGGFVAGLVATLCGLGLL